jgi:hypothetical protein
MSRRTFDERCRRPTARARARRAGWGRDCRGPGQDRVSTDRQCLKRSRLLRATSGVRAAVTGCCADHQANVLTASMMPAKKSVRQERRSRRYRLRAPWVERQSPAAFIAVGTRVTTCCRPGRNRAPHVTLRRTHRGTPPGGRTGSRARGRGADLSALPRRDGS